MKISKTEDFRKGLQHMKKHLLTFSGIVCAGLAALVLCAAGDASASGTVFSSAEDAAKAVGEQDVQIEVIRTRICPDAHRSGKDCYVQEILGRVVCAGKNAAAFHAGDCVGLRGTVTPCGNCPDCKAGRAAACGGCDNCAPLGVARPLTEERWVTVQKVLSGIGRLKGAYSLDELIGILLGERPEGEHPATWGLCRGGSREELSGVLHALQAVRCFTVRSENAEGRAPVPWGALHPVLTPYGFRIARREIADFTFVWPGEIPEQQPRPGRTRAARGTGRKTGGRSRPCASRKGAPKGGNRG